MDDLFSLDSVRDFMLSRGGRVKNHDLVTHFKSYLNDPNRKGKGPLITNVYLAKIGNLKLKILYSTPPPPFPCDIVTILESIYLFLLLLCTHQ